MLKIFSPIVENTGVGFYRIFQHCSYMASHNLAKVISTDFDGNLKEIQLTVEQMEDGVSKSDLIFTNTAKTQEQISAQMAMRDWKKKKLVIDVDDNLVNINEDHVAFASYNNPDLRIAEMAQRSIMYADLVTTTNEFLADLYAPLNRNIFINPNSIDLKLVNTLHKKTHDKLRIGWAGATGHANNQKLIAEPLRALLKKYPDVELVTLGENPGLGSIHTDFVTVDKYYDTYADLGFDIALAPLADTRYNRGKSNLRLIEASAWKIPVVASPVGPYKDFPCLYAEEKTDWYTQLERLILDEQLRRKIGEAGYAEVKKKYDIKVTAPKLAKKFESLIKKPFVERE